MQDMGRRSKMKKAGLDFISNHFCHSVQQAGSGIRIPHLR